MVKYTITKDDLKIFDCYQEKKERFQKDLNSIKAIHGNSDVWLRSMTSLKREWAFHVFCYNIGYKRDRTKDADLNYPCDKPEWVYNVLGWLVWPFIP